MAHCGKPPRRLAGWRDSRTKGKQCDFALTPGFAPELSGVETLDFLGALVDLRDMSAGATRRQAGFIMSEAFCHPFVAGGSRQRHRRDWIAAEPIALEWLCRR